MNTQTLCMLCIYDHTTLSLSLPFSLSLSLALTLYLYIHKWDPCQCIGKDIQCEHTFIAECVSRTISVSICANPDIYMYTPTIHILEAWSSWAYSILGTLAHDQRICTSLHKCMHYGFKVNSAWRATIHELLAPAVYSVACKLPPVKDPKMKGITDMLSRINGICIQRPPI